MCPRHIVSEWEGRFGEGGGRKGGRTGSGRSLMFPHASRTSYLRPLTAC